MDIGRTNSRAPGGANLTPDLTGRDNLYVKLRRLSLYGFKTFARRSEVEFDRGVTAIVGPNGSGKSNVIDALRWALGETNARELRGARMEEIIFSGGSGSRGRMQLAEVGLTFE